MTNVFSIDTDTSLIYTARIGLLYLTQLHQLSALSRPRLCT